MRFREFNSPLLEFAPPTAPGENAADLVFLLKNTKMTSADLDYILTSLKKIVKNPAPVEPPETQPAPPPVQQVPPAHLAAAQPPAELEYKKVLRCQIKIKY